jgi:hypothetical protein
MLRQTACDAIGGADEGAAATTLMNRNNFHCLYGGLFSPGYLQMATKEYGTIYIQALLIQIHDQHPAQPGGQHYNICQLLTQLQ